MLAKLDSAVPLAEVLKPSRLLYFFKLVFSSANVRIFVLTELQLHFKELRGKFRHLKMMTVTTNAVSDLTDPA